MKAIITIVGTLTFFANVAVAQQKVTSSKIKVKKDSCYMSEYDMNGTEIRVPCSTKHFIGNAPTGPVSITEEIDPATGFTNYFKTDFDSKGTEIKRKVTLLEEFDATGKSSLFIKELRDTLFSK